MNFNSFRYFNSKLDNNVPRMLVGPTGIGKTSFVKQLAQEDDADFILLSMPEYEPSDIVGFPQVKDDRVVFSKPFWWPEEAKKTYILLDEIDRASMDMQPVILSLSISREVGRRKLPDDVTIFAARNGDKYMTFPLDQAVVNRFATVEIKPTVSEWLEWAKDTNISNAVLSYISQYNEELDTPTRLIGVPNVPCQTRRSWTALSKFLSNINGERVTEEFLLEVCTSMIGSSAAHRFVPYYVRGNAIPSLNEVFANKSGERKYTFLQLTSSIPKVAESFVYRSKDEQRNAILFYKNYGDYGNSLISTLISLLPDSYAAQLYEIDEVKQFVGMISND